MAQRYSAGRGLCDGEEAAPASQVPADSCELCSQTPLSAPDMCLLESGDSDSFGMLAVLCSERQEEKRQPFQHALQLCQLHLGIGAIHKNMQMEFSWAEPRKAMFDQIRQSFRDAGGRWSEVARGPGWPRVWGKRPEPRAGATAGAAWAGVPRVCSITEL